MKPPVLWFDPPHIDGACQVLQRHARVESRRVQGWGRRV